MHQDRSLTPGQKMLITLGLAFAVIVLAWMLTQTLEAEAPLDVGDAVRYTDSARFVRVYRPLFNSAGAPVYETRTCMLETQDWAQIRRWIGTDSVVIEIGLPLVSKPQDIAHCWSRDLVIVPKTAIARRGPSV